MFRIVAMLGSRITPATTHPPIVDSFPNFGTNLTQQRLKSDLGGRDLRQNQCSDGSLRLNCNLVLNHAVKWYWN